ncbi:MAG: recombinase family protein [Sulfuricaulis sp.]|nr:recombinase family protein [Sulfuricaulis sp.]
MPIPDEILDEERQILSIEAQLAELREHARKESLAILDEFVEAKTAKVPGRPVFNAMMERIERGEAAGILAWHPDRLARNSVDGGRIIYLLDTGKLATLKFPTFWFESTPQGKFMLNIAFGQSKYYVDNLSENVRRGIRQKLRRGEFPGKPPIGYLNEPRLRTIVVDPESAPLVRRMFETYSAGRFTLKEVRKQLASWGLVNRAGKALALGSIKRLLMHPFYVGQFYLKGELYEGSHEPLISRDLFERVQEVMARRGKVHTKRRESFPFLGLLQCGECGSAITAERQKGHHYYRCTKKLGPCTQRYIREEALAAQVRQAVQQVALSDGWAEKMLGKIAEWKTEAAQTSAGFAQESQARLSAIQAKLDRLLDAHLDGAITREEYLGRKEKWLREKSALTDRMAEIRRNGNHWLEPLENFINAAHQAQIVAAGHDLESLKDFLKRIGSNLRLSGQTLRVAYENPWAILARHRLPAAPCATQTGETTTAPSLARCPRLDPIGENEKWWAR